MKTTITALALSRTSSAPANRFRPWVIELPTDALSTLRRILTRHLAMYRRALGDTSLRIPFTERELNTLLTALPEEGGNIIMIPPTLKLLGYYALYLSKYSHQPLGALLPDESSITIARHVTQVKLATINPTRITFRLW